MDAGSHERRRFALVIHALDVGGAQQSTVNLARAWPSSSDCLLVSGRSGDFAARIPSSIDLRLIATEWPSPIGMIKFALALRRLIMHEGVSGLLTNSFGTSRFVLLLKKMRIIPASAVIVIERSTLSVKVKGLFTSRILRRAVLLLTKWLYRGADAILGVSEGVSRDLEAALGMTPGAVKTINDPVDALQIQELITQGVPDGLYEKFCALKRPIVLTAGRMVSAKGHSDLLDAFARLPKTSRGSLVILGDGPLRQSIEEQGRTLGLSQDLWLPGFVDNPWWYMHRADLFVLSSHWEGFGLVLVEALVCGVPIVATDCPSGPREILAGVSSASLTPVGDPSSLASAIEGALRGQHSPPETEVVLRFSPSSVAARYESAAHAALASVPRKR